MRATLNAELIISASPGNALVQWMFVPQPSPILAADATAALAATATKERMVILPYAEPEFQFSGRFKAGAPKAH